MSLKLQQVDDWMGLGKLRDFDLNVDVHFIVDGVRINCHRLVLAASSDLFAKILLDHPESDSIEVHFPGISYPTVKSFLDFIYTGKLVCDSETVNNMISLLNELDFRATISDHGCKSDLQLSLKNIVSIAGGLQEQTQTEVVFMLFQEESGESAENPNIKSDLGICSTTLEEPCEQSFQQVVVNGIHPDIPNGLQQVIGNGIEQNVESQSSLCQKKDLNTLVINANTVDQNSLLGSDITNKRASLRKRKSSNLKAATGSGNNNCSGSELNDSSPSDSDYGLSEGEDSSDFTNPVRVNVSRVSNGDCVKTRSEHRNNPQKKNSAFPKPPPSIKCRFCNRKFNDNRNRLSHEVEKHHVSRHLPYACDKCDEKFKNPMLLKKHNRFHIYGVMVYPCKTCGALFEKESLLTGHAHKHRKRLCKYCKNTLHEHAEEHYKNCLAKQRIFSTTAPTGFLNLEIKNVCPSYNNTSSCQQSANSKHPKCKYCSKRMTNMSILAVHLARIHGIPKEYLYECSQCDNRFASYVELIHHKVVHNPGMLPYKCSYCEQFFGDKTKLKYHTESEHSEIGIRCRKCKKAIPFTDYKEHMESHTPSQCDICGKYFKNSTSLKYHQLVHLDQTKWEFKCNECEKSFKRKDVLELHVMNKHTDRQLMPHRCAHCSAGFMHKSRLVVHMKRHRPSNSATMMQ